jgi:hypothetical protein
MNGDQECQPYEYPRWPAELVAEFGMDLGFLNLASEGERGVVHWMAAASVRWLRRSRAWRAREIVRSPTGLPGASSHALTTFRTQ